MIKAFLQGKWLGHPLHPAMVHLPTGAWTAYGPQLREPVGPIHWAGAETATVWSGYMDGAVRSGDSAADAVAASLMARGERFATA